MNSQSPMNAPYLDSLLKNAQFEPECSDEICAEKLVHIFNEMKCMEAMGDDESRTIWIIVSRGEISDFGSFEDFFDEGFVETENQFEEYWLSEYPEDNKWYRLTVKIYLNEIFFFVDSKLTFQISTVRKIKMKSARHNELAVWMHDTVMQTLTIIRQDLESYNNQIRENLPYNKRIGRVLRNDYWAVFPDEKKSFKKKLPSNCSEILERIVIQSKMKWETLTISKITAGDFFKYCELAYDANDYFDSTLKKLNPKEKYLHVADGRDCGLRNIDENSEAAFNDWFRIDSHCGGHPWEICRGGNSTHISLFVFKSDEGWLLRLAGCSRVRVIETVLIAIALYKNKIPFILEKAEEILRMINGVDYIGIVPDNVIPQYCPGLFPPEDKIIDFINLRFENSDRILQKIYWYPEDVIRLIKKSESLKHK